MTPPQEVALQNPKNVPGADVRSTPTLPANGEYRALLQLSTALARCASERTVM
jgi:hypothetical protein